jgi:hypothetical protein
MRSRFPSLLSLVLFNEIAARSLTKTVYVLLANIHAASDIMTKWYEIDSRIRLEESYIPDNKEVLLDIEEEENASAVTVTSCVLHLF